MAYLMNWKRYSEVFLNFTELNLTLTNTQETIIIIPTDIVSKQEDGVETMLIIIYCISLFSLCHRIESLPVNS